MGLFKIFKRSKSASDFKNSEECKNLLSQIELHNKELKVVRKEYFGDQGKTFKYYYPDSQVRSEGNYYYLGYDKRGVIVDEKFQGKNIEYYENGQVKEIVYYKDGVPTGEFYYYDENGNLQ